MGLQLEILTTAWTQNNVFSSNSSIQPRLRFKACNLSSRHSHLHCRYDQTAGDTPCCLLICWTLTALIRGLWYAGLSLMSCFVFMQSGFSTDRTQNTLHSEVLLHVYMDTLWWSVVPRLVGQAHSHPSSYTITLTYITLSYISLCERSRGKNTRNSTKGYT